MTNQKLRDVLKLAYVTIESMQCDYQNHDGEECLNKINEALSEPDWQPIETAPKGEDILCWPYYQTARFIEGFQFNGVFIKPGWYRDSDVHPWEKPTHWMPLPKPPTQDK